MRNIRLGVSGQAEARQEVGEEKNDGKDGRTDSIRPIRFQPIQATPDFEDSLSFISRLNTSSGFDVFEWNAIIADP